MAVGGEEDRWFTNPAKEGNGKEKKKKKEKKERNKEHARDPSANRSNKVNPIQFLLIIVWLYITPPHSTKTSRERMKSAVES